MEPEAVTWYRPRGPLALRLVLAPLRRGAGDPTFRAEPSGAVWRTALTPAGPGTLRLARRPEGEVLAEAWGPGAEWLVAGVPDLLGAGDDPAGFVPRHPVVADSLRRHPGLRLGRTGLVMDALVPAVLEQRVTGLESRRSWRDLLRWHGSPAPGPAPAGMRVTPSPAAWARIPSWDWHRAGVDGGRSGAVLRAAAVAPALERSVGLPLPAARARLATVPGVGPWTVAEVAQRALGDPDAVSVGDFHIPAMVGWALAGRRVDDDGMLALLEPYRPQRQRVVRLLEVAGLSAPRRGPRYAPKDMRAM